MRIFFSLHTLIVLTTIVTTSCSGSVTSPSTTDQENQPKEIRSASSSSILCGLYQITCFPEGCSITPLRQAEFNLNVLHFLEPPVLVNVQLVQGPTIDPGDNHIAEVVIGLHHPFVGVDDFTGFDVKGVVFAAGYSQEVFNETTNKGGNIITQVFHDNFNTSNIELINPDGYTDFFNPKEYPADGSWVSYIDGLLGWKDDLAHFPNTVNPYKYFSDDLSAYEDISQLKVANRGYFSAGATNTRSYRFRNSKPWTQSIPVFNYAVAASWEPPSVSPPNNIPGDFPLIANQTSPLFLAASTSGAGLTTQGGNLNISCKVIDWQNDAFSVYLEAPGLFLGQKQLNPAGGDTYILTISNEIGFPAGDYQALLTADTQLTEGKAFQLLDLTVNQVANPDWSTPVMIWELTSYWADPYCIMDSAGRLWAFWIDETGTASNGETMCSYYSGSWSTPGVISSIPGDARDGPKADVFAGTMYLTFSDCAVHTGIPEVLFATLNTPTYIPGTPVSYYAASDIAPTYQQAFRGDVNVHYNGPTEIVTLVWQDSRPVVSPYSDILLRQRIGGAWQTYIDISSDNSVSMKPNLDVDSTGMIFVDWYDQQGGNWLSKWNGVTPYGTNSQKYPLAGRPEDLRIWGDTVYIPLMDGPNLDELFYTSFPSSSTPPAQPVQLTNLPTNYYGITHTNDGDTIVFSGIENISGIPISGSPSISLKNIIPSGYKLWDPNICVNPVNETYYLIFEGEYNSVRGIYFLRSI